MASAGGEHTLYRNADGSLFSAGACGLGWCRLQDLNSDLFRWRPVPLPNNEPVRLMHASYYHNLAVGASTGKLYSWGCGTFTEQGLDGVIPALGPNAKSDLGKLPEVVPLPMNKKNANDTIAGVSGGAYHSIVWMSPSDTILTFGAGQLGQLGRKISKTNTKTDNSGLPVDPIPAPAEGLPTRESVASIAAGFYNTLVTCKSGSLYCAGENQNQQCGQGAPNLQSLTKVKEVTDVEQVEGGYCHTLVKTYAGKVFSLGCGDDGQRGDGRPSSDDDENRPVVNPVDLKVKATQVAAGSNHSVILGANGIAYTFGANDVGQCGVSSDINPDGDEDDEVTSVFGPRPVPLPKNAGKVVKVSAGYAHTVLTTESGKVFVFGQNDSGQLGVGAEGYKNGSNPEAQTEPVESFRIASNRGKTPSTD
jgi:alpha-tubulin suppressor-like RCC1 family protein